VKDENRKRRGEEENQPQQLNHRAQPPPCSHAADASSAVASLLRCKLLPRPPLPLSVQLLTPCAAPRPHHHRVAAIAPQQPSPPLPTPQSPTRASVDLTKPGRRLCFHPSPASLTPVSATIPIRRCCCSPHDPCSAVPAQPHRASPAPSLTSILHVL
jgi:hypothetical protein